MGENSIYSPARIIGFLTILPIGVIDRTFLNILPMQNPPKKLLEQLKGRIQLKHYSNRTGESYIQQIRHILFHKKRHPKEMGHPGD
jgi:hypothetical protein